MAAEVNRVLGEFVVGAIVVLVIVFGADVIVEVVCIVRVVEVDDVAAATELPVPEDI